jgi:membrane protein
MRVKKELRRFVSAWNEASTTTYGAAVAYYTVFSLAPLLIVVLGVAGIVFNTSQVQIDVITDFGNMFGANGATLIQSLITSGRSLSSSIVGAVTGIILIMIGATGIFNALHAGFDVVLKSQPKKQVTGLWKRFFKQIVSIGMVFAVGLVLIASLMISAILHAFSGLIGAATFGSTLLLSLLNTSISYPSCSYLQERLSGDLPSMREYLEEHCSCLGNTYSSYTSLSRMQAAHTVLPHHSYF